MTSRTYLFYDIETTGLNKCFDQVLNFAAIRTNSNLETLSEHEFDIKLNPDVIPSPESLLIHGMGLESMQEGMRECDAMVEIHKLMNEPGTISLGYNTLGFDDEFLRFSFFRHFLSPYTHQFANQCRRMDLYPITTLYHLYDQEVNVKWPEVDGKVSLKLEELNRVNQFVEGASHNAMVDVKATLELARRFHENEPMWNYACQYFEKTTDQNRQQSISDFITSNIARYNVALMVNGPFGSANNFLVPALCLGPHQFYRNQTLWLRLDREDLIDKLTESTAAKDHQIVRKRHGEAPFVLPCRDHYQEALTDERLDIMNDNLTWLEDNSNILDELQQNVCREKYPEIESLDCQATLYAMGFPTPDQSRRHTQFALADMKKKGELIRGLTHPTRHSLAIRLIGRYEPELLNDIDRQEYDEYIAALYQDKKPMNDYRGEPRRNAAEALAEVKELKEKYKDEKDGIRLISELEEELQQSVAAHAIIEVEETV
jgi:exodeoxyribonuclease-1